MPSITFLPYVRKDTCLPRNLLAAWAGILFISLANLAGAQGVAATDELIRQQERERQLREQLERAPDVRLDQPVRTDEQALVENESPCFRIDRVELDGPDAADFQWLMAAIDRPDDPPTGRCLGAQAINQLMTRMQNRLIAGGYVTSRIVAAPQDLSHGVLTLTVVVGRVRRITSAVGAALAPATALGLPLREGEVLNLRDVEQGLENLKRIPAAEADIRITASPVLDAPPGASDLVVDWRDGRTVRVNLSLDDSGTKATGRLIGGLTVSLDNALGLNDLFYTNVTHDLGGGTSGSRGTRGYTAHYSVPVGYWLVAATASGNRYHQAVAGATQTYRYGGDAESGELRVSRVLHRDASSRTSAHLKAWVRQSSNAIDDTEILVQRRRMGGWEAGFAQRAFLSSATLDVDLAYRRSTGAFGALPPPEQQFGEADARAGIWLLGFQMSVPFSFGDQRLRYQASGRLQRSDGPLVPQDRFAIGGRYTVRGFDGENLLTGDRGWLWRNDLALPLRDSGAELYVGMDMGLVSGRSAKLLIGRRLSGAALGVRGQIGGLAYDVFAGRPISRPAGFQTPEALMGFTLNWSW